MRIGLCGTMSVGKSTLVKELSKLDIFKEYNIRTERSKYLMEQGIPLNTDSTVRGQMVFMSERSIELMQENIITDRTIWDVCAFTQCSLTINDNEKNKLIESGMMLKDYYDWVFYIDPEGVDIEDNGIRTTDPDYRDLIDKTIKDLLQKHPPKNYAVIKGETRYRIQRILNTINGVDF